jgi:flagellar hook-associated protein 3
MRITNQMLSNNFLRDMRTNLNNLGTIQTQMASGKQINRPSDDPAKASKIMRMYSEIDANKQYNSNIKNTSNWLDVTDTTLDRVGKVIGRINELLVSTGGSANDVNSRKAIKDEINQRVEELSQLLNTSFDGKYIFGGTNGSSKPMGITTDAVTGNSDLICNIKPKVVTKQTAGTMTSANTLAANNSVTGTITLGTDTFTIDEQSVDIDWDTLLTDDQKSQIQSDLSVASPDALGLIKDTLVNAINLAIDDSGKNVSHVTGSLDKDNKMVLQSGKTGTESQVKLNGITSATSIGSKILSDTDGAVSTGENIGTSVYGGAKVVVGAPFNMSINGVSMSVIITPDAITSGTNMVDAARTLTSSINKTIDDANTAAGLITGDTGFIEATTVTSAADGKSFEITSPSGTITFSDTDGKTTTENLGLSVALKDKLLVEVSQGVTMDYNVTASQIINYGTDDGENLMKLLGDITSHLDSTDPTVTENLTNADLSGIQKAMSNVLKLRSEVGAKQNRMESAETINSDQNLNMTEILSSTEDIDITEKAMEYATMQTIYMASLQTSAKILQPSLIDYL